MQRPMEDRAIAHQRDGQSVREFAMEVAELRRKAGISEDH
ncbi:hypothetical protein T11_10262 [Trichinella zimbabwensis]|uniref:Retrotransposon gag domain-containing protein n=1 Tax=Trichinella zimbabwensis TaxID=268475 RepID=A0A0V1HEV1_9BILA|nr:hypothetical protein T11_10262 [Trichinella zimbabwensis]